MNRKQRRAAKAKARKAPKPVIYVPPELYPVSVVDGVSITWHGPGSWVPNK